MKKDLSCLVQNNCCPRCGQNQIGVWGMDSCSTCDWPLDWPDEQEQTES